MRRTLDFYPTPRSATLALLDAVPELHGKRVYEPCAGDGAIGDALGEAGKCTVSSADIDPSHLRPVCDARKAVTPDFERCQWVVTNPPFSDALTIIRNIGQQTPNRLVGSAYLLRLSFLEPTNTREAFLKEFPPHKLIVLPRLSFTGDGKTDSVTAAWVVWATESLTHSRELVFYSREDLQHLTEGHSSHVTP